METHRKEEQATGGLAARFGAFVKSGKGRRLLVGAGILGIALILLSEFLPAKSKQTAVKSTAEDYIATIETQLADIIGSIEGAGECRLMVTLENGVEYVYASQQKSNTDRVEDTGGSSARLSQSDDTEQSIIVVDTEDGRQGLLVTEIQPTVKGVVVVCQGGDQPEVSERVVKAVTTALNISAQRVCVTKLQ